MSPFRLPRIPPAVEAQVRELVARETFLRELEAPSRPGWIGFERVLDGLSISAIGPYDSWVALPGRRDDRAALVRCPCCIRLLKTSIDAMEASDNAYPPR